MIIYLPFVLFGSGTPFPIGAFDSEEKAQAACDELGKRSSFTLELPLNENWELQRRVERMAEAQRQKEIEDAKPKPEWEEIVNNDYTQLRHYNPDTDRYEDVGFVYRMPKPGLAPKVQPWKISPRDLLSFPDEEHKTRKKAINTLKRLTSG